MPNAKLKPAAAEITGERAGSSSHSKSASQPVSKLITLAEAVRRTTRDGMQYASGAALPVGSDAIAFGRELLRQNRRDLHAIFHCNTQQLNLLAAAGAVSRAECGFSGLEGFGFANGLRRAVESGVLVLEDYSNLAIPLRLLGGALNWPFVPATVNIGSDLQYRSAFDPENTPNRNKIPSITDPFTGRVLGAFSSLQPDLAAIHVTLADVEGNAIMLGTEWSRFELSRAAKRVVLLADAIVDPGCIRQFPNLVRIPGVIVEAVVYWPFAAWPQGSPGMYDVDEAHMKSMNKALASEEGTAAYLRDFVQRYDGLDGYLDVIGRDNIARLSQTATGFLLDPYRRWILPHDEVLLLLAAGGKA
ncbi:CoA transferase subunit A [Rhodocyclus tenuis]|uniref:CoA transferase subunit A n=1 Tax=Rhodocyclus tenuis TaxID=1066 RepID=UPI0019062C20|nr:CoA-transferase [Rhodocyclus tenuis]MBK1679015.1 glutaconate CoA-transferase [Rhodocyclus tenuis]